MNNLRYASILSAESCRRAFVTDNFLRLFLFSLLLRSNKNRQNPSVTKKMETTTATISNVFLRASALSRLICNV